ncbi:hypothetical protein ACIPYS_06125 [Kitasatospora sp. NPDC089913]|uniref:hypothetical protein n=1 Tax=Streptomycetaceae TaxID=2062 RepID=UPI00087A2C0D|nr:hypothetical protein [Streptomyces sp. TLI_053]SDT81563.1 hypothetical protein SAMN05216371_6705 [Streptomyces sp. TLI_053]
MSLRKAFSSVAVAGIMAGGALIAAPSAQAATYTYIGIYPTAASCHAAGQAYVSSHRAIVYFCDTTTETGPARLSVVLA